MKTIIITLIITVATVAVAQDEVTFTNKPAVQIVAPAKAMLDKSGRIDIDVNSQTWYYTLLLLSADGSKADWIENGVKTSTPNVEVKTSDIIEAINSLGQNGNAVITLLRKGLVKAGAKKLKDGQTAE